MIFEVFDIDPIAPYLRTNSTLPKDQFLRTTFILFLKFNFIFFWKTNAYIIYEGLIYYYF